jgi:cyclopropane fatty-acyl-phospholipid synthase-like methyltransferase
MTSKKTGGNMRMARANWVYDEMRQIGVDFENVEQVAQYDAKQGTDRDAERQLVDRLCIAPGQIVLDIGCGTGSFSREAARAGARVRAIDVSQAMLTYVEEAASNEGISNLQVEHAGFLTFDAAPDSVDVIVSRFALHHLPDFWKQAALLRFHETLRASGRLYLYDVVFSFGAESYEASVDNWVRRMPESSGFSRQEFETHVREEYTTYAWVIEGLLERAGFCIIEKRYPAAEYAEYVCTPTR